MIDHLISRALRRIRQAGHDIDSFILGRQRRRYLRIRICFTSEESQPLLELLNSASQCIRRWSPISGACKRA